MQIFQAIDIKVRAIPGIGDVGGPPKMPLEIQRYPALFYQPGVDVPVEYLGNSIDRNMQVLFILWIRTQENVLEAQEVFLPKVILKLNEDYTLGGLCKDFREGFGGVSEPFSPIEGQPDAAMTVEYTCTYRVRRDNPYLVT